ncbi:Thioredoxin-disulfide reductase [Alteracholeplasma palmae J233]|uniref:Thioredoxin-disulfide reductase n=1 Tax=Alteracholeplasma palmae (strain ATCC 49389 / J233) TaxID=1318466 RepID=U4KQ13_ALTPJ|nr:NAD(P)/FAD-dependent oxidoreductase [Alteracholeplasma palmae]CCV64390.1 Thioredoxin-disulfide reductase [Alteracholeplasma palmae J233]
MNYDVIIIGGGPAGLSAALTLGRAKRLVLVISEDLPRNRVTYETHGFLTNDSISPKEFYEKAYKDLKKYPNIVRLQNKAIDIIKDNNTFFVTTNEKKVYESKKVIIASGVKDKLPEYQSFKEYYGKSIFPCPFCDGWEHKDHQLALFLEDEHSYHYVKMISQWNNDLIVFTNGKKVLSEIEINILFENGIKVVNEKIKALHGNNGLLESIELENKKVYQRNAAFIKTSVEMNLEFADKLNLEKEKNIIKTTVEGKTSCFGVYLAGDVKLSGSYQIATAVAQGLSVAIAIHAEMVNESYKKSEEKYAYNF